MTDGRGDGRTDWDVVVVGLGALGSAAAYWASTRPGTRVLGLERFELGHANGASADHSRIIRLSYHRPLDDCPTYIEYFKDGDDVPSGLCPIHSGSLKQRAQRAVQGVLGAIGRSIRDIFR